ncbi:hypothetical protein WR25_26979 [Diploscapter pachys]|uniref:Uncharacterized protein n=1 Tax=Diploscapter pachys TaxID=2018661 RepID=A0A2A2M4A1_9BILA|nr:hypothetical protein WR25_26979 [Diploscapter pachys]
MTNLGRSILRGGTVGRHRDRMDRTVLRGEQVIGGGQERHRVHRMAVDTDFIMQVRAGRTAGRPHQCDQLAARHARAIGDEDLRQMAIAGRDALAVVDLDQIAVTALAAGVIDDAVGGGIDRRADRTGDVDARMHRRGAAERVGADAEVAACRASSSSGTACGTAHRPSGPPALPRHWPPASGRPSPWRSRGWRHRASSASHSPWRGAGRRPSAPRRRAGPGALPPSPAA